MFKEYIVLSGNVSVGKSTLADSIAKKYNGYVIKTNDYIKENTKKVNGEHRREDLQKTGESLDKRTGGGWVVAHIEKEKNNFLDQKKKYKLLIIDSVRIEKQIEHLRKAYGNQVFHIHIDASDEELEKRYKEKSSSIKEVSSYELLRNSKTEKNVYKLKDKADVVINTDKCTKQDVFIRACAHIKLSDHKVEALVDVLVGAQYGSEGKGNVAAYISPEYDLLVRVGGPNAGHKVYDEPTPQIFRHLPSGTKMASKAHIVLGPGMVIDTDVLLKEIADCQLAYDRLSIDKKAIIIEKRDIDFETQNQKAIASTGKGVGSATARRIQDRSKFSLDNKVLRMAEHVPELRPFVKDTAEVLENAYENNKRILLEGTQGTSLSLYHGNYPHVTSRDTTVAGCLAEAGISPKRVRKVILVCRTYPIRVAGTSGHMEQEISWEEIHKRSGIPLDDLLKTEKTTVTNNLRRVAEFDWGQLKQSVTLNAPTDIALTFIDYLDVKNREARRFEQLQEDSIRFVEEIERVSGVKVSLISTRFHWRSIIDRRSW